MQNVSKTVEVPLPIVTFHALGLFCYSFSGDISEGSVAGYDPIERRETKIPVLFIHVRIPPVAKGDST